VSSSDWIESRLRRMMSGRAPGTLGRLASTAAVAAISRRERTVPFWPIAKIEALQRRRLQALLRHAQATVPFYRDALQRNALRPDSIVSADDLSRLPMIDGLALAEDPMRFVSEPFRRSGREVFKTSGSSAGLRKPIFWDHGSLLVRAARGERDRVVIAALAGEPWAHVIAREFLTNERRHTLARWLGVRTQEHQRLLILPADFSSRTQRTIYSEHTVIPRKPVHYHHLPPAVPFHVAAAQIAAIRPRVVLSFGSYADQFFHYLHGTGTKIPLPRLWVYLGDRLSAGGRELAESMGCAVYAVYGAMEAGTIGFQCERRDGFHLNLDLCAVRIADAEGNDLPPGESGDVVISPLDNRAMVLLNYRLGDRAAIAPEPCGCGRTLPLLVRMEGRRSEIIRLADGRELSSLAIEASFGAELRRTIQAQIEQQAPGRLRWRVVASAPADNEALRDAFIRRSRQVLGAATTLEVEFVEQIARTPAGKFMRMLPSTSPPAVPARDAM
jgi:phenylacetate-CoA ligase